MKNLNLSARSKHTTTISINFFNNSGNWIRHLSLHPCLPTMKRRYFTSMIPTKFNLMADTRSNFVDLTILRPLDNLDTQQFDVSSRMRSPLLGRTSSKPLTKYSMSMSNSTMQNLYLVKIWTSPHHIFTSHVLGQHKWRASWPR